MSHTETSVPAGCRYVPKYSQPTPIVYLPGYRQSAGIARYNRHQTGVPMPDVGIRVCVIDCRLTPDTERKKI